MNLSIYKKIFLFVLLTTPLVLMGDGSNIPSVECVSYNTFPLAQCQTNTPKIKLRTENGVGEDANFEDSKKLIIQVNGPNDNNDFNDVNIITQKPLINQGKSYLERENGTVVLKEGQQAATNLKQKDAIIIVNPSSGLRNLDVNASSGAAGQDAGNVVVVADNLENLSLTADGYHGQNGESVSTVLAKRAMGDPSGDMHEGIADSYLDRRENDQNLPLDFDSLDLNNYAASGLQCRPDETAVGGPGSYAYETATDPGSVPEGIAITSLAREQTKRSFCRRDPEFSVTQECQAEKEYSFQAVCSVIPEGRSVRFNKRKEVRWQRAVCASDVNAQVRRKIVRSANIEISIPGMKSYSGTIQREITFAASYNVYKKKQQSPRRGWWVSRSQ